MISRRGFLGAAVGISHPARTLPGVSIARFGARPNIDCRAEIQAAADAGQGILIPPGDWQASPGVVIPRGVDLMFAPGAQLRMLADHSHLFTFLGRNRVSGGFVVGSDSLAAHRREVGTAAFNVTGASDVIVEDVRSAHLTGDVFRIADSRNITIRRASVSCRRNILTLNDDVSGSSNVLFEDVVATSGLNGFQAESDDNTWVVEGVTVRRFCFRSLARANSYGVAFTKSARRPSSFAKYRAIRVERVEVSDAYCGLIARGADDFTVTDFRTRGVDRGIDLGAGSSVKNVRLTHFDLQASKVGVVVHVAKGADPPRGIQIGPGAISGLGHLGRAVVVPAEGVTLSDIRGG